MAEYPKREYHCRTCAHLLFRTDAPPSLTFRIETVCPDRRCQRMNNYRFSDTDRPGNRRVFLESWYAARHMTPPPQSNGSASPVSAPA